MHGFKDCENRPLNNTFNIQKYINSYNTTLHLNKLQQYTTYMSSWGGRQMTIIQTTLKDDFQFFQKCCKEK